MARFAARGYFSGWIYYYFRGVYVGIQRWRSGGPPCSSEAMATSLFWILPWSLRFGLNLEFSFLFVLTSLAEFA
jgi:hypothetical protein